jgi:hypothetical protein
MMIINDMMIIDEVRNKNKIIKPTNLRPSSIKATKLTIIRRIIRSKLHDLPILNCHTPLSYIFIKLLRKPPFSYFFNCLTEGIHKKTILTGFLNNFLDFSRFPSKLGQNLSDSCQTLSKLSSMSSQ